MTNGLETAEAAIEKAHEVAPWLEGILPMIPTIGVPAAAVVKVLDGLEPVLLNALGVLAKANNGNILSAAVELANHLTPGMQNSSNLGPSIVTPSMPSTE